jgi:hypothetical protein
MQDTYAISRVQHTPHGDYKRYFCSECQAEILNWHTATPYYHCVHNAWGATGQRPSDREVLDAIREDLRVIRSLLTREGSSDAR